MGFSPHERLNQTIDAAKLNTKEGMARLIFSVNLHLDEKRRDSFISFFSNFPDGHQRDAAAHILAAGQAELREKYQNNPRLLARAGIANFLRQVVETLQIAEAVRTGQPVAGLLEPVPVLTLEQEDLVRSGVILVTMHSGNPLAVLQFFKERVVPLMAQNDRLGVFTEEQPPIIQTLYQKIARDSHLSLLPTKSYISSYRQAIRVCKNCLVSQDRHGESRIGVTFLGDKVGFSPLAASLALEKKQPILPLAVVVNQSYPRSYQLVFGQTIKPEQSGQNKVSITQTIASAMEEIILQHPESFYFLSPLWQKKN